MTNISLQKCKKKVGEEGYVLVFIPQHPKSFNGWYYEHRIVIEQNLNRLLNRWETIHHINGNKQDNRIENLFICVEYQHKKAHQS